MTTSTSSRHPADTLSRPSQLMRPSLSSDLRVAWVYDFDACKGPTGVTRHALAQLDRLAQRPDVRLRVVSGRIQASEGLMQWEALGEIQRCELPLSTRNALRFWRVAGGPPLEWWTGPLDWAYSPSDYSIPVRAAKRAVTCHDILQDVEFGTPRRRQLLAKTFGKADLVLSVSQFNTAQLHEVFPHCREKVAYVPNAADDLFFSPATPQEREAVRADLGLLPGQPYLLSVANFQPRKNLANLIHAAGTLEQVRTGELALVLLGDGAPAEARLLREAIATIDSRAIVKLPGYRQGSQLRAIYAEAVALVFPSVCESFGIPTVEAMAQGTPVALANNTALPEIGGAAGWYFEPRKQESIAATLWALLDDDNERQRRIDIGRVQAARYRWDEANQKLVKALFHHR